jgi:DNA polymerase delta subunit 1
MKACFFRVECWPNSELRLFGRIESGDAIQISIDGVELFFALQTETNIDQVMSHFRGLVTITSMQVIEAGEYMGLHATKKFYLLWVENPWADLVAAEKLCSSDPFLVENVILFETDFHVLSRFVIEHDIHFGEWYDLTKVLMFPSDTGVTGRIHWSDLKHLRVESTTEPPFRRVILHSLFTDSFKCIVAIDENHIVHVFSIIPPTQDLAHEVVHMFRTERDLLMHFMHFLGVNDFDIFVHHGGASDLFPRLQMRMRQFGLRWPTERVRQLHISIRTTENKGYVKYNINQPGRLHIDMARIEQERPGARETDLASLCRKYLNEQLYPVTDVVTCICAVRKIERISRNVIAEILESCRLIQMDPQQYVNTSQQAKLMCLIQRFGRARNLLKRSSKRTQCTEKLKGGTVREPLAGIYTEEVSMLDYEALYPSIMIAHNLCFSTILTKDEVAEQKLVENEHFTWIPVTETPLAVLLPTFKQSLLCEIQNCLQERRQSIRDRMVKPGEDVVLLDIQQRTVKVLRNAMYGFLARKECPFYLHDLASAITAYGRHYIDVAAKIAQEEGAVVIFGVTDSIAVKVPAVEAQSLADKISSVTAPIKMRFECSWKPFYVAEKKDLYGGWSQGRLKAVGLTDRTQCALFTETLMETLRIILASEDLLAYLKKITDRICSRNVRYADLVFHGKLNQSLSTYGVTQQVTDQEGFSKIKRTHDNPVSLALKRNHSEISTVSAGTCVDYVAVQDHGFQDAESASIDTIDWDYYLKHLHRKLGLQFNLKTLLPSEDLEKMLSVQIRPPRSARMRNAVSCIKCDTLIPPEFSGIVCPKCNVPGIVEELRARMQTDLEDLDLECAKCIDNKEYISSCSNVLCRTFAKKNELRNKLY